MILQTNVKEFKQQLKEARKALQLDFQTVMRETMLSFLERVALRTPVSIYEDEDPGRLAGSWTISRGKPGAFMIPKGQSSSPEEAIARASGIQFANPYALWYLYNRVEYAEVVEFGLYPGDGPRTSGGFSTQAPAGMLRITQAELVEDLESFKHGSR